MIKGRAVWPVPCTTISRLRGLGQDGFQQLLAVGGRRRYLPRQLVAQGKQFIHVSHNALLFRKAVQGTGYIDDKGKGPLARALHYDFAVTWPGPGRLPGAARGRFPHW